MLMICLIVVAADEPANPLDKEISGGWTYNSFDEAVGQIEQKTGFKVYCPKEIETFLQTIWMKGDVSTNMFRHMTARKFLDMMGGQLALKWQYDAGTNAVTLELPWKFSDDRSPADLLKAV